MLTSAPNGDKAHSDSTTQPLAVSKGVNSLAKNQSIEQELTSYGFTEESLQKLKPYLQEPTIGLITLKVKFKQSQHYYKKLHYTLRDALFLLEDIKSIDVAVQKGDIKLDQEALENSFSFHSLPVAQYLIENMQIDRDNFILSTAVMRRAPLAIIKFLHQKGFSFTFQLMQHAYSRKDMAVIWYLMQSTVFINYYSEMVRIGKIEKAPTFNDFLLDLITTKQIPITDEFIHEVIIRGLPEDYETMRILVLHRLITIDDTLISFVKEHQPNMNIFLQDLANELSLKY